MARRLLSVLALLLALFTVHQESQAAIGYTAAFMNPTVSSGKFTIDIYLLKTGSTAMRIGNANFWFNYNSAALSNPVVLANGIFDTASFNDYNPATLTSGTYLAQPYVSYNVLFNGLGDNGLGQQPSTSANGTLVCTIQWDITNSAATTDLAFQSGGYALTTDVGASITASGDWTSTVSSQPLPVELKSFTASVSHLNTTINWSTATETNNFGFDIERKSASTPWAKIGFVAGKGNSATASDYSYVDEGVTPGKYDYRIKQINKDGSSKYSDATTVEVGLAPKVLTLSNNYPNPFNPTTNIEFTLPQDGRATLAVYNSIGQQVATLFDGEGTAGYIIKATFDAKALASGMYFARLQYGGKSMMKKMLLLK